MFGGNHIQIGAGRYFQCPGALKLIGQEVSFYGNKAFLLFGDEDVKAKTLPAMEASLRAHNVDFEVCVFEGPSTIKSFNKAAQMIKDAGASAVVGIGGGRIIDIAKGAGDIADVNIFTAPTSAATCAAYAVLYVIYGEDGSIMGSGFLKREISGVLVDTDIVIKNCPKRYFISGIADAMAKKPEFAFTMLNLGKEGMIATSEIATMIGDYTYSNYLKKGGEAVKDFENGKVNLLTDDFVNMNVMLTGMVSDLSTGGKQLAIAHNFYDAICCLHPEIRKDYLHGELVGMALPLQIYVNGGTQGEISELKDFLTKLGVPMSLRAVGFPDDEKAFDRLVDYIHRKTIEDDEELLKKIRMGMEFIM